MTGVGISPGWTGVGVAGTDDGSRDLARLDRCWSGRTDDGSRDLARLDRSCSGGTYRRGRSGWRRRQSSTDPGYTPSKLRQAGIRPPTAGGTLLSCKAPLSQWPSAGFLPQRTRIFLVVSAVLSPCYSGAKSRSTISCQCMAPEAICSSTVWSFLTLAMAEWVIQPVNWARNLAFRWARSVSRWSAV